MAKKKKNKKKRKNISKYSPDDVKISEALLRVTNSFIDKHWNSQRPPELKKVLPLAVIGWNLSLFPQMQHSKIHEIINDTLPGEHSAETYATVIDTVEKFSQEKQRLYPQVRQMIQEYKLFNEGNETKLTVEYFPFDDTKIQNSV